MQTGAQGPVGVTGMWGGPVMQKAIPEEMDEMTKAVHCVNAMETLAVPVNTRHVLASIAISLRRQADYAQISSVEREQLKEHLTILYKQGLDMKSHKTMAWSMLAFWIGVNIAQLVLKLMGVMP